MSKEAVIEKQNLHQGQRKEYNRHTFDVLFFPKQGVLAVLLED
jgi:hypothetical protein